MRFCSSVSLDLLEAWDKDENNLSNLGVSAASSSIKDSSFPKIRSFVGNFGYYFSSKLLISIFFSGGLANYFLRI